MYQPGSLKNLAFDTGVLAERARIIEVLKEVGSYIILWDGTDQVGNVDTLIELIGETE